MFCPSLPTTIGILSVWPHSYFQFLWTFIFALLDFNLTHWLFTKWSGCVLHLAAVPLSSTKLDPESHKPLEICYHCKIRTKTQYPDIWSHQVKAGTAFGRKVAGQIDREDRYTVIRFTAAVIWASPFSPFDRHGHICMHFYISDYCSSFHREDLSPVD